MRLSRTIRYLCLLVAVLLPMAAFAASVDSLKPGKAELKSAGALAFGPDGVLFVGDSIGAAIFAVDTKDRSKSAGAPLNLTGVNEKIAAILGSTADQILINDMAVNPISHKAYVSVSRGRGPDATPVLLRIDAKGKIEELSLDSIPHSRVSLPNAPDPSQKDRRGQPVRAESITDLHYVDGKVFVAGLSSEEFSSNLRAIPFPFANANSGTSVEIFHGSHGRLETNSPIRTFVPYEIRQEPYILAAYTCTPLVKLPVKQLQPGVKVMGTTIAELGNRNRPLDMVVYKKGASDYILMSNSSRGVMKMSTEKIDSFPAIKEHTEKAGLSYETLSDLKGIEQLDRLDDGHALLLARSEAGSLDLKTIPLP